MKANNSIRMSLEMTGIGTNQEKVPYFHYGNSS